MPLPSVYPPVLLLRFAILLFFPPTFCVEPFSLSPEISRSERMYIEDLQRRGFSVTDRKMSKLRGSNYRTERYQEYILRMWWRLRSNLWQVPNTYTCLNSKVIHDKEFILRSLGVRFSVVLIKHSFAQNISEHSDRTQATIFANTYMSMFNYN